MQLLINHMHVQSSHSIIYCPGVRGYREHLQRRLRLIFFRQNVRFVYLD